MAWRYTDLPYLAHNEPEELRSTIIRLARELEGNLTAVAETMGISRFNFYQYIKKLDLRPELDGVKDEFAKARRAGLRQRRKERRAGGLVGAAPAVEAQTMLWAFKDAKGSYRETAVLLGISVPKLYTLVKASPGLKTEFDDYAASLRAERLASSGRAKESAA